MNIALCDDDAVFLETLENQLKKYNCTIFKYTSAEKLISGSVVFDIAFLDIEFGSEADGFALARFLKKNNPKCIIVFFTNYSKYAVEGYEYRAFRYILKNEPKKLIEKRIKEVIAEFYRLNKVIKGSYKDKTFAVTPDEIYYIEVFNHILLIHSSKGDFELYHQIKDMYEELSNFGFVRCHRSFIVNIKYIHSMQSDGLFLMNAPNCASIPIGARYRVEAKAKYLNYEIGDE